MNLQARPYRDPADLIPMRQLLMAGTQSKIPASYTHPGCLDWDTQYPPDEEANRHNLRLWECVDENPPLLEAWAIFSRREGSFDLFVSPAIYDTPRHERVMAEYIAWAEDRARAAGLTKRWPFWAMEHDKVLARLHQAHGYVAVQADPPVSLFERTLDELPTIRLPDGFTVQGVSNLADGQLRAAVLHSHFRPNGDWHAFWAAYAQFMGTAVYDGERDLFVCAPDGRGASACTIWFDSVNGVGLFEPVSTHPDFQGKGLGKAVMTEGLRRMKAAGMTRASVGFDPTNKAALALYTSMGFGASAYFTFPSKEL